MHFLYSLTSQIAQSAPIKSEAFQSMSNSLSRSISTILLNKQIDAKESVEEISIFKKFQVIEMIIHFPHLF